MNLIKFFVGLLIIPYGLFGKTPLLPVLIDEQPQWLCANHFIYFTHDRALNPKEALRYVKQIGGDTLRTPYFHKKRTVNYCWVYGQLRNDRHAKTIFLTFEHPEVHWLVCLLRRKGKIDTLAVTGDAVPFQQRPIISNYFVLPIKLQPAEELEVLLFLDKRYGYMDGKIGLYSQTYFAHYQIIEWISVACFLAILGYILLFNLFLFFSLHDTVHALFIIQLLANAVLVLCFMGYARQFLWPDLLYRNGSLLNVVGLFLIGINLLLMRDLLGISSGNSRLVKLIVVVGLVCVGYAMLSAVWLLATGWIDAFIQINFKVIDALLVIGSIVMAVGIIEQVYRKNTIAYLYVVAIGIALLGNAYLFLVRNGIQFYNGPTHNVPGRSMAIWLMVSCLVEQVTLAFGLTMRYNRFRQQNLNLQLILSQERNQTTTQVINAQEIERQRLAADLHDDLGGTLATIRRRLTDIRQNLHDPLAAEAFDQLEPLVQKSAHDLRRIAHNLMPPEFERLGLRHALEQLVQSQPAQSTRFSFVVAGQERRLPLEVELNLYRIVSELVQNIYKHAQARRAAVQLLYYDDHLLVMVEDDGLGSQTTKNSENRVGLGLKNSSLRAEYIGARLRRDVTGAGTLVVLDVPYVTPSYGVSSSPLTPD